MGEERFQQVQILVEHLVQEGELAGVDCGAAVAVDPGGGVGGGKVLPSLNPGGRPGGVLEGELAGVDCGAAVAVDRGGGVGRGVLTGGGGTVQDGEVAGGEPDRVGEVPDIC